MMPSASEISLIDRWQRGFPLITRPFAEIGREFGIDETETMATFERLRKSGAISRIGAVVRPHTIGASTLAAMSVPQARLEEVAEIVNREPAVNHNYERAHELNLWFVIAGADSTAITSTINRIEKLSRLAVLDLPLTHAYHIDLGFPLNCTRRGQDRTPRVITDYRPEPIDRTLLAAIEDGLPIVARPYRKVAEMIGLDEEAVISRLRQLSTMGVVSRFGCVVRHRTLGYVANAMAVWDIPDADVDKVADQIIRCPEVTLCYRRPRRLPKWPFNLFCMIHGKTRRDTYSVIDEINLMADTGLAEQAVLLSTRCFKQRGAVFSNRVGD